MRSVIIMLLVSLFFTVPATAEELTAGLSAEPEYLEWAEGTNYLTGDIVTFNDSWYRCLDGHLALVGWTPIVVVSVWKEIDKPKPPKVFPPPLPLPEAYDYSDNVAPSPIPPGGLSPEQIPMLISFGWDDLSVVGYDHEGQQAMKWLLDYVEPLKNPIGSGNSGTFDGAPVRMSFYPNSTYMSLLPSDFHQKVKWAVNQAFRMHHEVGNHTHAHNNNEMSSDGMWLQQISATNDRLVLPAPQTEADIGAWPAIDSQGAGIPREWLVGLRSPYLKYNDSLFTVLRQLGFMYDISIEDGYQQGMDGTNFNWPYTLDNGSPGHDALLAIGNKDFTVGSHPGLWELPAYPVIVPERYRDAIRDRIPGRDWIHHDSGKIAGLDYDMWYYRKFSKEEFVETLKHTLDLRLAGNRAPLLFGAHPVEYSERWNANNAVVPTWRERQEAMEEFIEYALTKKDVRIVPMYDVLQWVKNPVPLTPEGAKPKADFVYQVTNDSVALTDTSQDSDGTIVSWQWDFGDGQTSSVPNPSHRYALPGNYSVSLVVTDSQNLTDTKIISIDISSSSSSSSSSTSSSGSSSSSSSGSNGSSSGVDNDFNGDGIADIFWRNATDGRAEIALGNSDGVIEINSKSSDWNAQLGDFNGDGAKDTLWRNAMTGAVTVALSDASGNQGMVNNLAAKGSAWLTHVGDFNGDGRDDILWRKPSVGSVAIGISDAAGQQDRLVSYFDKGAAWQVFVGDFNGDGRDDMLWRRGSDGASKIVFTNAQGTQESVVNAVPFKRFSAWQVQIADLNNDGRDDILWRKSSDGTVKIGISGADGKQASSVNHFAKFMAWTATLGDFNGDGGTDILWRKPADGTVKIAITDAAGEQASVVGLPARFSAWTQQLADYNGDGRTDILWHKPVTGEVTLGISSPMGYQQSEVSMDNKPSGWTVVH